MKKRDLKARIEELRELAGYLDSQARRAHRDIEQRIESGKELLKFFTRDGYRLHDWGVMNGRVWVNLVALDDGATCTIDALIPKKGGCHVINTTA